MIDFKDASFLRLEPASDSDFSEMISPMFIPGEKIIQSFRCSKDGVVFTNKRIFAINVQGIGGKRRDFTSLRYSAIQAFSIGTLGVPDYDSQLVLWFTGMGQLTFGCMAYENATRICQIISANIL